MKKFTLVGIGLFTMWSASATELSRRDSIGVEKVGDKTFIIHQVDQSETLFGISRRYQVAINDILQSNDQMKGGLQMGQRIRVPYITKEALPQGAALHKVEPGETLFSISKKYNTTVSELMAANDLKGNDLSVGQALVIKNAPASAVAATQPAAQTPTNQPEAQVTPPATQPATPPATQPQQQTTQTPPAQTTTTQPPVQQRPAEANRATSPPATNPPANQSNTNKALPGDWITHTVVQGETLFSIAKTYNAKLDDLISWNALTSNNLNAGQNLKVGREAASASSVPVVPSSVPIVVNNERKEGQLTGDASEPDPTSSTAYKNIKETGLAELIDGTANHKKYLVLHRDAPVGTIMRVRNEENDITIFARVVGRFPEVGDSNRLVIKLSKAAYDQLKAVNSRFPVEVSY